MTATAHVVHRPTEAGYRPSLDGLRAVAVYLVVVFHAGSDRFVGGYVGVDVFFVLSGFLVTQLLLRDLAGGGSISLRRFYARRFRRLLPAAFVVLIVTALVYSALASPIEVTEAVDGFQASFLYYANWQFITQSSDYFGADINTNPVLQFWSLAVEEQFYLLWPLLLGGLFAISRRFDSRQRSIVRTAVLVGAVASLLWAWSLKTSDPNRAYYGTDARAYQLLAGALLALTPGLINRLIGLTRTAHVAALAALAALIVIASSWIHLDAIERGLSTTAMTLTLLIALEVAQGGIVHGALSRPSVVYLGKISYGTYLWHWPVILVMARTFDLSPLTTIALTTLIATALASLSYQILEHPIRLSPLLDGYRTPVIATGLAISIVSALVLIPAITSSPERTAAIAGPESDGTGLTPVPTGFDWNALKTSLSRRETCRPGPAGVCTLVEGTGSSVLLMGDSHAGMMIPAFKDLAVQEDLTLSVAVLGGCPWQRDLYATPVRLPNAASSPPCDEKKDDTYDRVIPALDPDIIVVMNLGYEAAGQFVGYLNQDGQPAANGSPEDRAWLDQTTAGSIASLQADEQTVVVVIEPIPLPGQSFDPLACLSEASALESCRYVVDSRPSLLERQYRRLDESDDHLWSVSLDELVCPFLPICDPIVRGKVVKVDDSHLTPDFARSLVPALAEYFRTNGILP